MISLKRFKINALIKKLKIMQQSRQLSQPKDEVLAREARMYHSLAKIYHSVIGNAHYPFAAEMEQECLRAAAGIDDADAQFRLGEMLLNEAKFHEQLEKEGVFSSSANQRQMRQLYEEAHAYLKASQLRGNFQGKRLQGICYINGWGVEKDRNKGFELVVASIEQENSWDKVPEIFASISGKDTELFSDLMRYRSKY